MKTSAKPDAETVTDAVQHSWIGRTYLGPLDPPAVYKNGSLGCCLLVLVDEPNQRVHYVAPGEEGVFLKSCDLTEFRVQYHPVENYSAGFAAFRFINPVLGGTPVINDAARTILEVIMKAYLLDIVKGSFLGKFDSTDLANAAGKGKKSRVVIETVADLSNLKPAAVSKLTAMLDKKSKVTEENKVALCKELFAAIKVAESIPLSASGRTRDADSKSERAYAVFTSMFGKATRGEIIAKFRGPGIELTEGGAPTYYYLCHKRMTTEYAAAGKKMPEAVKPAKKEKVVKTPKVKVEKAAKPVKAAKAVVKAPKAKAAAASASAAAA